MKNTIDKNDNMWEILFALRLDLVGEALNNEENIGNITKGRCIKLKNEEIRSAISGNMINYVFNKNLRLLADKNELCDTCKIFSPMKNGKITDEEKDNNLSESGNRVKKCIIDDVAGFMNAGKGANEKRSKIINFSWGIATQGVQSMALYNRIDTSEANYKPKKDKKDVNGKVDTTSLANTNKDQNTQMIFHRPIRSNEYSIISNINLSRICFDDERQRYVFEDNNVIKERIKKVLLAYRNTIIDIKGALCSTNLPQILGVNGVMIEKTSAKEVLSKYSPLNDNFKEVHLNLNKNNAKEFNNVEEFVKVIDELMEDSHLEMIIERNKKYIENFFD